MNNHLIRSILLLTASALLLSSCGDNSALETPNADANNINTEIPDFNSFSTVTEKLAVESINFEGNTSNISVLVADRHNNPVPDNTTIFFLTNGGKIDQQCSTANGACSVTWTEQTPTPSDFQAKILAYTSGEESFTDLNDNDKFDAGEPFTDISEPFFDINENGIRDSNEEFVDVDNDNVFDGANGLFTGEPCVGDNTVCDRRNTLIWDSQNIVLSGSFATVLLTSGNLTTTTESTETLTFSVRDSNGNPLADGTTVAIDISKGSVDPGAITFAPLSTGFTMVYTAGADPVPASLKITVTSQPSQTVTIAFFDITVN